MIDERTNTLIITDLPGYLTNVQGLLQTLDTPIPGVEIEARIVVDEVTDAILAPAGTLFRERGAWCVFRVVNGRAVLQPVDTGKSNGLETEIIRGVAEGDQLILHPSDEIEDGVLVREI